MENKMSEGQEKIDLRVIEAEENLLLDMQFLLQELITDRQISRVELAKMTGISKSRLSQIMGSDANPTLKTCARLFHALGEELNISLKKKGSQITKKEVENTSLMSDASDWRLEIEDRTSSGRKRAAGGDVRLVALLKEAMGSNDNYRNQVEIWHGGEPSELQAA
jgi:transcriptional regulator with XRE-family HTH domain